MKFIDKNSLPEEIKMYLESHFKTIKESVENDINIYLNTLPEGERMKALEDIYSWNITKKL